MPFNYLACFSCYPTLRAKGVILHHNSGWHFHGEMSQSGRTSCFLTKHKDRTEKTWRCDSELWGEDFGRQRGISKSSERIFKVFVLIREHDLSILPSIVLNRQSCKMMLKKVDDLDTCDKWLEQYLTFDRQSMNKAAYVYHKQPIGQFT